MASRLTIYFFATRPKFLTASAAPVLVGSAMGFAVSGFFDWPFFILATLSIMALHAGSNTANDYFDHISQNDWVNQNPTPYSGGRRYIQQGILSAKSTLILSICCLAVGAAIGLMIVLLSRSMFILAIGIVGLCGGYFYTAWPFRLGYRGIGEIVIAFLFGILPVYGAYYLQTGRVDVFVLFPACLVGILIFLVILVNEFPDSIADAKVNKKTLVVLLGIDTAVWIYRIAVILSFVITGVALLVGGYNFIAGLCYMLTFPIALKAIRSVNKNDLSKAGSCYPCKLTILLHLIGALSLATGFVISGCMSTSV